jgi:hypothetical protein
MARRQVSVFEKLLGGDEYKDASMSKSLAYIALGMVLGTLWAIFTFPWRKGRK